jgi:deoxyadenosine/deoxycytidine kinase
LNERYEAWIQTYDKGKLLIIDVDNLDFVENKKDLQTITDKIDDSLKGL